MWYIIKTGKNSASQVYFTPPVVDISSLNRGCVYFALWSSYASREMRQRMDQIKIGKFIAQRRKHVNLTQLQLADRKIKELLSWVFGSHNDFEQILDGVSLLAVATNGQRVLQNLLDALEPILHKGLQECAAQLTRQAREERGQGC